MSLKEISIKCINEALNEEAREELYGDLYVPYMERLLRVFHRMEEVPDFDLPRALGEFAEAFPDVVLVVKTSKKRIEGSYMDFSFECSGPFSTRLVSLQFGHNGRSLEIPETIPFNLKRNNRLLDFFLSRKMPVFEGIRSLRRLKDT